MSEDRALKASSARRGDCPSDSPERHRTAVTAPGADPTYAPLVEWCREWDELESRRCDRVAEFLLWGKLFPPEALGPRCYDCAAKHAGHRALGDPQWAILDLRRLARGAVS